jgi:hypothetical protein
MDENKKIVLTVKQKLKLIEKFENGESATKLAKDYEIGIQTVCDIKNNKMKLMKFVRDYGLLDLASTRILKIFI